MLGSMRINIYMRAYKLNTFEEDLLHRNEVHNLIIILYFRD